MPISSGIGALGNVVGGAVAAGSGAGDVIIIARVGGTIFGATGGRGICEIIKQNCDEVCKKCEK